MSRILAFSADQELTLLRKHILESAGHEVVAPLDERDALEAAARKNAFDLAIVCYRMWPARTRQLMRIFRENNREGKFLVMVRVYGEMPDVEGDRYSVGADGPHALLKVVHEMESSTVQRA